MTNALADTVKREAGPPTPGQPVLVGFSGGLDSSVLLHLLAADRATREAGLRAIHVHHGLHADADAWATHCQETCATLDIPLIVTRTEVDRDNGLGLEGAAREARHRAFADALAPDEVLALAHHRDDQAETFLLRALRGSGVEGLAAMRPWRAFANGWLWRPLLQTSRADLQAYAQAHGLRWIEDPGNLDSHLDRNFLRNEVLPLLRARWPHADASFGRSAMLAAQATDLLTHADDTVLAGIGTGDTLRVEGLLALDPARRARVLRRWIAALGLPPLPASGIDNIEAQLLTTRSDAEACFEWAGARVQRWRDVLHAGCKHDPLPLAWEQAWDGSTDIILPTGDTLTLSGTEHFEAPLRVHARQGGERIVLPGRDHSHALKHVLQERGVPPWERRRLPLLSQGDELLAAGDDITSSRMDAWLRATGARLQWKRMA